MTRTDTRPIRVNVQLGTLFNRPPPHAPETEMALLGAMILDHKVTGDVAEILSGPEDFFNAAHGAIYAVLIDLYNHNRSGDLVELVERLRSNQMLADIGGAAYLEKLAAETPGSAGAAAWATVVAGKAALRRLVSVSGEIMHRAYTHEDAGSVAEVLDRAEQAVFDIAHKSLPTRASSLGEILQQTYERVNEREAAGCAAGVPTGFYDLDALITGLEPGLIIIGARPSMGKTAFAVQVAEQMADGGFGRAGIPVGVFSMEMSKGALVERMLCARAGITTQQLKSGKLGRALVAKVMQAGEQIEAMPLYVDDTPGLTIMGLRARARRMVKQYGVGAVFVDYLQLMTAPGRQENRQTEVAAISRGIKALAMELGVPIVCLSQLNRGPESRSDNRPRMSDLRESGAVEQDADVIMLLHREEYYHIGDPVWENDPDNEQKKGLAEVIVTKQRQGPTGVVYLRWRPEATRFASVARTAREPREPEYRASPPPDAFPPSQAAAPRQPPTPQNDDQEPGIPF
jgi:replicative DNA helicase